MRAAMERVPGVYTRPHDPAHPVICMDETTRQCVKETRAQRPAAPGRPARYDAGCERNRVAHPLLEQFRFVRTPRHGSWLNMAEIEFSAIARQCPDRRLPDTDAGKEQATAWAKRRNACGTPALWRFATEDACLKLHSLYPKLSY